MKNIGWTKKQAEAIAKKHRQTHLAHDAYAKLEEHFNPLWFRPGENIDIHDNTCQYIVVIQKKNKINQLK